MLSTFELWESPPEAFETNHIHSERGHPMAAIGTTAQNLGPAGKIIQNLGPDPLYVSAWNGVTSSTGVRLQSGESISVSYNNSGIWAISSGTSDVRLCDGGLGIYMVPAP